MKYLIVHVGTHNTVHGAEYTITSSVKKVADAWRGYNRAMIYTLPPNNRGKAGLHPLSISEVEAIIGEEPRG